MKAVDHFKKEIKPGQTVVYPVRRGSSMWLSEMKVQQVVEAEEPYLTGYNNLGRRIALHNLTNVIIYQEQDLN